MIGIPVALVVVWAGGWVLGAALSLVGFFAVREFYALSRVRGTDPLTSLGTAAALLLILLAAARPEGERFAQGALALVLSVGLIALAAVVWTRGAERRPLEAASVTIAGTVYVGGALAVGPLLRHLPEVGGIWPADEGLYGALLLLFPLGVTWASDSAAYFAGRRWGRRRLMPSVSPGKTVVGGVAGLVVAGIVGGGLGLLVQEVAPGHPISWPWMVLIGTVVGAAGQVGDLAESVLKRGAGVKDSGRLLPGHGGALDRFDAILFALPCAYLLLRLFGGRV